MSRLPSATSAPSSSNACLRLTHLTSPPYMSVPCPIQPYTFSLSFPQTSKIAPFRATETPVLVSYWFARRSCESHVISIFPTAGPWELKSTTPFPSRFLLPNLPAGRLLDFPHAFTLVSCSAYSTLKIETICSSETSIDFQQTTRRYFPEDSTLHNYCCENLKSYPSSVFHVRDPFSPPYKVTGTIIVLCRVMFAFMNVRF
jgi:hypothetical protein